MTVEVKISQKNNIHIEFGQLQGPSGPSPIEITAEDNLDGTFDVNFVFPNGTETFTTPNLRGPQGIPGIAGLQGVQGETGPQGIQGIQGIQGLTGANGKDIELQTTATHIQWRYVGETWQNLKALSELKGADGINGMNGTNGTNGTNGINGADGADGSTGADGLDGIDGADGRNAEFRVVGQDLQYRLVGDVTWDTIYTFPTSAVSWVDISEKPTEFNPSAHNHDDRYYTETETDTLLSDIKRDAIAYSIAL